MREQIMDLLKKDKTNKVQPRLSDHTFNKPNDSHLLNLRKIKSVDQIEFDKT